MKLMSAILEKFDYDAFLGVVGGLVLALFAAAWCANHFFGWVAH